MSDHFSAVLENIDKLRILVIGDLMYDEFIWGDVQRISPEAPVQVLEWKYDNDALGGAANVANNLATLGCKVTLCGVVGDDEKGKRMIELLKEKGINHSGVIRDTHRPTTNKTRIIARSQQILRIDRENSMMITKDVEKKLLTSLGKIRSTGLSALIISRGF
jgi:rfaE bifunctional protein kinase chain/domain